MRIIAKQAQILANMRQNRHLCGGFGAPAPIRLTKIIKKEFSKSLKTFQRKTENYKEMGAYLKKYALKWGFWAYICLF